MTRLAWWDNLFITREREGETSRVSDHYISARFEGERQERFPKRARIHETKDARSIRRSRRDDRRSGETHSRHDDHETIAITRRFIGAANWSVRRPVLHLGQPTGNRPQREYRSFVHRFLASSMHKRVRDERNAFERNVDMSTVQDRETIGLPRWEGRTRHIERIRAREEPRSVWRDPQRWHVGSSSSWASPRWSSPC